MNSSIRLVLLSPFFSVISSDISFFKFVRYMTCLCCWHQLSYGQYHQFPQNYMTYDLYEMTEFDLPFHSHARDGSNL